MRFHKTDIDFLSLRGSEADEAISALDRGDCFAGARNDIVTVSKKSRFVTWNSTNKPNTADCAPGNSKKYSPRGSQE